LNQKLVFGAAAVRFKMEAGSGGKLWSICDWCLVPVYQHDLGCCDVLIGGVSCLKRPGSTPLESLWFFRKPSRAWV